MIRPMTESKANQKGNNAIKRKSIGSVQNRNFEAHRRATLICPTKAIIKTVDAKKIRAIRKKDPINLY